MNDETRALTRNKLLRSLPIDVLHRLNPLLERVEMPRGRVLYHREDAIGHVYFPDRAMISVVAHSDNGQSAEVAVIGSEGAAGLDVILGSDAASNDHITQIPDGALRMKTVDVRAEFALGGEFSAELLRFTRKFIVQISHTALCNRLHKTEKRLSRWLLMCHDRSDGDVMNLTQEFMAVMLGSNRTTVTMTAIVLQNAGFISYSRGTLTIVDRKGLEGFSCPCYQTIRYAYDAE